MQIRIRARSIGLPLFAALLLGLGGCGDPPRGPLRVTAIGSEPDLANPNLTPLDAGSAFLAEAVAQGLVRFDASGEIEPALAQSWIVSDDGLRYTFRVRQGATWADGARVTADQVAARLRAATSRASRNRLKPMLQVVDRVEAMTDQVLEIGLTSPRPNFLQLLAQPEMAIMRDGLGTGPYRITGRDRGGARLVPANWGDEEADDEEQEPALLLRGGRAAVAIERFKAGQADLVVGGTAGSLPIARVAQLSSNAMVFDPAAGLFGLAFLRAEGPLGEPSVRRALSMAVERDVIVAALDVPGLQPRTSLLPPGLDEAPSPASPDWAASPMAMRRELAARAIAEATNGDDPIRLRIAIPEGIGYRLIFAHLRAHWRAIGVEVERVALGRPADLVFIDEVAPVQAASWYLRRFACPLSPVCSETADRYLEATLAVFGADDRRLLIAGADAALEDAVAFIPIAAPVRWSLVSQRVSAFRPNIFARHPAGELIADRP